MSPNLHLRLLVTSLTFSFALLLGLAFLFAAAPPSQAQPPAFSFKDQDGVPVDGEVRVLCFAGYGATAPFADLNIQVVGGVPDEATPLPQNCRHLAALRLRHTQPAGKHEGAAYWIYATSWEPGTTHPLTATGDIVLSDGRPLTLINLAVSLGWEPAPASAVTSVSEVRQGLRLMAEELYDWAEGQMLVGPITIHTGGEGWSAADMRFVPANDKRPSAFVGGIVPDTLPYTGYLTNTTYTPAMVYLGRLWDGRDAFEEGTGNWTTPNAYRTLAHEFAHYALFLYDEYQDSSGLSGYCICDTLSTSGCGFGDRDGSAMAYHYQATEFWHKDTHLTVEPFCYETWQFHVHGQTDWDLLTQWHVIQGLSLPFSPFRFPMPELDAGPALGLAQHLIGREPGQRVYLPAVLRGGTAVAPPQEPLVNVILNAPNPPTHTLPSQVYLLKGGADNPQRILPQGRATGDPAGSVLGQIRLLDVAPDDTVRAYIDRPAAGAADVMRYSVLANGNAASNVVVHENPWDVVLAHHFELQSNRVTTLTLTLMDGDGRLSVPMAQLCSLDTAVGCHPAWQQPMTNMGGWWEVAFAPLPQQKELPRYAVVRLWDGGDMAVADELVQWVQVAGGVGPTHNDGMAPLLDAEVMVNTSDPYPNAGDCNVVSYMPMANTRVLESPLPAGVGGLLGIPLDIQITLSQDLCPPPFPGQEPALPTSVLLNMGYSQDEVDRLGLNEQTQLVILHYAPGFGWAVWQQLGVNEDLNWITASTQEDGIYAIGWRP